LRHTLASKTRFQIALLVERSPMAKAKKQTGRGRKQDRARVAGASAVGVKITRCSDALDD
jgi:hypothetical protein